jgi:hypothetical protein
MRLKGTTIRPFIVLPFMRSSHPCSCEDSMRSCTIYAQQLLLLLRREIFHKGTSKVWVSLCCDTRQNNVPLNFKMRERERIKQSKSVSKNGLANNHRFPISESCCSGYLLTVRKPKDRSRLLVVVLLFAYLAPHVYILRLVAPPIAPSSLPFNQAACTCKSSEIRASCSSRQTGSSGAYQRQPRLELGRP